MKTRNWGKNCGRQYVEEITEFHSPGDWGTTACMPDDELEFTTSRDHVSLAEVKGLAIADFIKNRKNGNEEDNSAELKLDFDGEYIFSKGGVKDGRVYGARDNEKEEECYEVYYRAGEGDSAFFKEKDCRYLARILQNGKLRELEPDVWYLREIDGAQNGDIGKWWSQKLKLSNIDALLKNAEIIHAIFTSWQVAPLEICELIAIEFLSDFLPTEQIPKAGFSFSSLPKEQLPKYEL